MDNATRRSNLYTQALFTARRVTYAGTLALLAAGAAVLKLGFNYQSALQQAYVALHPVFKSTQALNTELQYLYRYSAFTPFQFKDVTVAFRQLYAALKYAPGVNNPLDLANKTVKSIVDSLSYAGKLTPSTLQRASLALQHMAYSGRLTGYAVNQLARDGIPIIPVLNKELGVTGDQLHRIGAANIPVLQTLEALNKFTATAPGFRDAAFNQATKTLHGTYTTFKDLLSQASASGSAGTFFGLQGFFKKVDDYIYKGYVKRGKTLTMEDFFKGVNQAISPNTGIVLNFFYLLQGVMQGVGLTLLALKYAIVAILFPLRIFMIGGDGLKWQFRALGIILGVYLTLLLLYKSRLYAVAIAEGIHTIAMRIKAAVMLVASVATTAYTLVTESAAFASIALALAEYRATAAILIAAAAMKGQIILTGIWEAAMGLFATATAAATIAVDGFAAAWLTLDVAIPILGWIALAATGFYLLYTRWAAFRHLVDDTLNWAKTHWQLLAPILFGPFGLAAVMITRFLNAILRVAKSVYNWFSGHSLIGAFTGLPGAFLGHLGLPGLPGSKKGGGGGWTGTAESALRFAGGVFGIPGLAGGGLVSRGGLSWVGERGPELLNLPSGASVTPSSVTGVGSGFNVNVKVMPQPIVFDSRQVGLAMAQVITDIEARQ
jgi:tape measure domain-containing protein